MHTVGVKLAERSYDILIGLELLKNSGQHVAPLLLRPRVAIVTDETVANLHLPALRTGLEAANITVVSKILPAGESTKNWRTLGETVEWLLAEKIERNDVVIALGGGVIGDLVGFAAAILRRGVRFVQVPTSLLAQVDSAIGGKTGINASQGKNLIGAFHQPAMVLADITVLETLASRDFLAGYGEVVKYGLLGDEMYFSWLEQNGGALAAGDRQIRIAAVKRACEIKAAIVARDETERGDRALLNLGHTFCHALEAATGFCGRLLHGEGVAIGCAMAFELSARLGLCAQEAPRRVRAHLKAMGIKTDLADIRGPLPDAAALMAFMEQDKKVSDGQLRFVLARSIGQSFVTSQVPRNEILAVLQEALHKRQNRLYC